MKKNRTILNISGSATKLIGHIPRVKKVYEQFGAPDVITGISGGSFILLMVVFEMWDKMEEMTLELELEDFFDSPPVNKKGNFTAKAILKLAYNSILAKFGRKPINGFSTMNVARKTISEIITPELFERYKKDKSLPECYIGIVDIKTGSRFTPKVRDLSYEEWLDYTIASGSIPVFAHTSPKDSWYLDGGLRDHALNISVLNKEKNIKRCITLFSRPENYKLKPINDNTGIGGVLFRSVDILNVEISKSDEQITKKWCQLNDCEFWVSYLPSVLESLYDVDNDRLKLLWEEAKKSELIRKV